MKANVAILRLTRISLAAAILCVLSPLTLPLGALPLSLASFCLYLIALSFRPTESAVTVLVYLAVGLLGLPVFAGFTGGVQAFVSPTGGFLLAYLPTAFLASFVAGFPSSHSLFRQVVALLLGMVLLYAAGLVGYSIFAGVPLDHSLLLLFFPFLLGDLLKIGAALLVFSRLKPFLVKKG